jgi:hypothetical protein
MAEYRDITLIRLVEREELEPSTPALCVHDIQRLTQNIRIVAGPRANKIAQHVAVPRRSLANSPPEQCGSAAAKSK